MSEETKKCHCGRWKLKGKDVCFWCSPEISSDVKRSARSRGGIKNKIPVDVRRLNPLIPINDEKTMAEFLNELLRQNLVNYADDYDRFLSQTLRVLPRINDLMLYRTMSEQRQLLEYIKYLRVNGGFMTEVEYAKFFPASIINTIEEGDS